MKLYIARFRFAGLLESIRDGLAPPLKAILQA